MMGFTGRLQLDNMGDGKGFRLEDWWSQTDAYRVAKFGLFTLEEVCPPEVLLQALWDLGYDVSEEQMATETGLNDVRREFLGGRQPPTENEIVRLFPWHDFYFGTIFVDRSRFVPPAVEHNRIDIFTGDDLRRYRRESAASIERYKQLKKQVDLRTDLGTSRLPGSSVGNVKAIAADQIGQLNHIPGDATYELGQEFGDFFRGTNWTGSVTSAVDRLRIQLFNRELLYEPANLVRDLVEVLGTSIITQNLSETVTWDSIRTQIMGEEVNPTLDQHLNRLPEKVIGLGFSPDSEKPKPFPLEGQIMLRERGGITTEWERPYTVSIEEKRAQLEAAFNRPGEVVIIYVQIDNSKALQNAQEEVALVKSVIRELAKMNATNVQKTDTGSEQKRDGRKSRRKK